MDSYITTQVKLSVCMITYNHEEFIAKALESVLMQKANFEFEIVIGEDCSTDKTREILLGYKAKYPDKIRLILNNKNIGVQRNFCNVFGSCRGEYIALLEGDDYWTDPDKLQKQVMFLESHPDYVACYHDTTIVNTNGITIADSKIPEISKKDYTKYEMIEGKTFIPTLTLVSRNILKNFPSEFNKVKNGDNFLTSLLGRHGKCKYLDEIQPAAYRKHFGGIWSGLSERDKILSKINTYYHMYLYYLKIGEIKYATSYMNKIINLKEKLKCIVKLGEKEHSNNCSKHKKKNGIQNNIITPNTCDRVMEPLRIVCFKWFHPNGRYNKITVYGATHVNNLARMIKKNLKIPHEFVCITDNAHGIINPANNYSQNELNML